jgi:hypothetical protein
LRNAIGLIVRAQCEIQAVERIAIWVRKRGWYRSMRHSSVLRKIRQSPQIVAPSAQLHAITDSGARWANNQTDEIDVFRDSACGKRG